MLAEMDSLISRYEIIIKNASLMGIYTQSKGKKYNNLADAAAAYKHNEILIYFEELKRYGIFTLEEYHRLNEDILTFECAENIEIPFTPRQIIFSNQAQKFIIVADDKNVATIVKHAKSFFGGDITTVSQDNITQITIQKGIGSSHADIVTIFRMFHTYVRGFDQLIADNMKVPPQQYDIDPPYEIRFAPIGDLSMMKLAEAFGNMINNGNMQIFIGNNNTAGSSSNNNNCKETPAEIAIQWIKHNHPQNREPKAAYYARYAQANPSPIAKNMFGKAVIAAGFKTLKNNGLYMWTE
jgi:hypothetical protein